MAINSGFHRLQPAEGDFLRSILQCISRGSCLETRRTEEEQAWGKENGTRHSGEQTKWWIKETSDARSVIDILFYFLIVSYTSDYLITPNEI